MNDERKFILQRGDVSEEEKERLKGEDDERGRPREWMFRV